MSWRTVALGFVVGGLGFAAHPAPADQPAAGTPTAVELTVVGGPELNPNSQGRASPVVVRIFDLAATGAFEAADLQTLFEHPGELLKQDLVTQEELILRPGGIEQRDRTVQPGVRALGVAAEFRDIEHATWRLVVPIKAGQRNFVLIDLNQDKIRVETIDPGHP